MKELVFIAGPYFGDGASDEINKNIRVARGYAVTLAKHSVPFFCPHTHTAMFHIDAPGEEFYRALAISVLRSSCCAMLLLPRYTLSQGALIERAIALNLNLPLYYSDECDRLVSWYKHEIVPRATMQRALEQQGHRKRGRKPQAQPKAQL